MMFIIITLTYLYNRLVLMELGPRSRDQPHSIILMRSYVAGISGLISPLLVVIPYTRR